MIHTGDCIEVMAGMPADSVDAVVTDPPYGLEFMGKDWDSLDAGLPQEAVWKGRRGQGGGSVGTDDSKPGSRHHVGYGGSKAGFKRCQKCGKRAFSGSPCKCKDPEWVIEYNPGAPSSAIRMQRWHEAWALEALRVTKPGGYLLAFGGGRTHHRLTSGLEDAGWVIRETLVWVYASGFAKSRNVSRDLEQAVPEGARCACAPHSTRTALGSQDGYRPERGSGDAPLPQGVGSGRAPSPSRGGVRGRSRGGPGMDDPVLGLEHSPDLASSGRPSIESLAVRSSLQAEDSRASDSGKSGKPSSTSDSQGGSEDGRTPRHTPSTQRSGGDSVAASWSPPRGDAFPYSKCTSCGGWQTAKGWGTALKPAAEYIVMARKPLVGNVAANVAQYGTGAINVDGTRIGTEAMVNPPGLPGGNSVRVHDGGDGRNRDNARRYAELSKTRQPTTSTGRWPSSVLLSDPELFDEPNPYVVGSGATTQNQQTRTSDDYSGEGMFADRRGAEYFGDSGGYSRFFIVPKADRADREPIVRGQLDAKRTGTGALRAEQSGEYIDFVHPPPDGFGQWLRDQRLAAGLQQKQVAAHFPSKTGGLTGCVANWELEFNRPTPEQWLTLRRVIGFDDRFDDVMTSVRAVAHATREGTIAVRANSHPTVKPTDLMRHLVRLVTPSGGTVLDCFAGSGSTLIAAELEGFPWIGIEKEPEYVAIAEARLNGVQRGLGLDVGAPTKPPPKTHPDLSKHQPKVQNYAGGFGFKGFDDEEPAA